MEDLARVLMRLAVGAAVFGLALVVAGCTGGSDDAPLVDAFDLDTGDCFNSGGAAELIRVQTVDCAESHGFEVYHRFELPDGPFPGTRALEDRWIEGCLPEFEGFVGLPFEESMFDVSAIFPTEVSWDRRDDREVLCSVTPADGGVSSGSARGSRR